MLVKELKDKLSNYDDDFTVVISSDSEGNRVLELQDVEINFCEKRGFEYNFVDDPEEAAPVVVLWP